MFTRMISPATTVTRNTGIHLFGTRRYSITASSSTAGTMYRELPSSVTSSSAFVDHADAWSTPHCPTDRSASTRVSLERTR